MIDNIEDITADVLVAKVKAKKDDGNRLVTMTCTDLDEANVDLIYHFDKATKLTHLRMKAAKAQPVPSVTGVYFAAFLVENEIQDQFGLKFDGLALDFAGTLYMEDSVRPNPLVRYSVVQSAPAASADKPA